MLSESFAKQPWWCVRPQLMVTLAVLLVICAAVWVDTPARKWVVRQVVVAEVPEVLIFAKAVN